MISIILMGAVVLMGQINSIIFHHHGWQGEFSSGGPRFESITSS